MEERNGALSGDLAGDVAAVPLERLEAEITSLNAHLSAATCRWLVYVGEFDRRGGHETWGCYDLAQYLNWKCGIDRRTAREHVRVARALPGLPRTLDAFSRGELSYSKVRAITRVATPENEEALVDWARHGTASHLERIVRGYGTVLRNLEMQQVNERHARRSVRCHQDDDGSTVLTARLDPEAAAEVMAALEAMEKEQAGSAEPRVTPREDPETLRADALVAMAEAAMAGLKAEHPTASIPEVVVHVDVDVLADDAEGRCELAGGTGLAPETARRLACDARIVVMVEDADGNPLHVGRRRRTPSAALRRALASRDGGCRFPGCEARRFLHAHHVQHWGRDGETEPGNLLTLCSKHHRLVHEGGFTCHAEGANEFVFQTPDGRAVQTRPATVVPLLGGRDEADARIGLELAADAGRCRWGGENLHLDCATDALWCLDGRREPTEAA